MAEASITVRLEEAGRLVVPVLTVRTVTMTGVVEVAAVGFAVGAAFAEGEEEAEEVQHHLQVAAEVTSHSMVA